MYGSGALTVTGTTGATTVPNLTQTISVPGNSVVYISTDGGVANTTATVGAWSAVDISIFIDGALVSNGGYNRLVTTTGGGGGFNYWSISLATTLSAASHTISVVAAGGNPYATSSATVSGNSSSTLQGELSVLVLKR